MNNLIIDNNVIVKDIKSILGLLKNYCTPGKLNKIIYESNNVRISCPVQKDGLENKPSCNIYIGDDENITWGTAHCFACGFKGSLAHFVAEACNKNISWAQNWLKLNFTEYTLDSNTVAIDEPIVLNTNIKKNNFFDDSILENFQSWHPYMEKRKLSKEVCEKYDVKYDPKEKCIVFPVRNLNGKISFLTRRSVESKRFIIDKNIDKDIYLLYDILNDHIKSVYVCESQINALTLESWGYRAIALLGTGTEHQYELHNKAGIINYYLCLDGDEAGRNGIRKFIANVKNAFISIVNIPEGKDVNDLTKDEFEKLKIDDVC